MFEEELVEPIRLQTGNSLIYHFGFLTFLLSLFLFSRLERAVFALSMHRGTSERQAHG